MRWQHHNHWRIDQKRRRIPSYTHTWLERWIVLREIFWATFTAQVATHWRYGESEKHSISRNGFFVLLCFAMCVPNYRLISKMEHGTHLENNFERSAQRKGTNNGKYRNDYPVKMPKCPNEWTNIPYGSCMRINVLSHNSLITSFNTRMIPALSAYYPIF